MAFGRPACGSLGISAGDLGGAWLRPAPAFGRRRLEGRYTLAVMSASSLGTEPWDTELRSLVDEYRIQCLWFLRPDYYPATREEALRVLRQIERHGDRTAFVRAGRIRQWLSRNSSERSAAS